MDIAGLGHIRAMDYRRRRYPTSETLEAAVNALARVSNSVKGTSAEAPLRVLMKRIRIGTPPSLLGTGSIKTARLDLRAAVNFFRDMEEHTVSRQIIKRMWRDADVQIRRLVEIAEAA